MIEYSSCFGEQEINAAAAKANNDKRLGTAGRRSCVVAWFIISVDQDVLLI
jgi:hypothetical protein